MKATFFEAWRPLVERGGGRPAVEAPDAALTRAELWAWAGAVGEGLARAGAGPGALVGLSLEKSAAYVAALLGAWWAGAAFVPLAPSLPAARRRSMLAQAAPAIVLDEAWVAAARPGGQGAGARPARPGGEGEGAPAPGGGKGRGRPGGGLAAGPRSLDPEAPAYVMFTSGSGGAPKGVVVAHRGVVNVLAQQIEAFGLDESSRSLFVLSTSFDASVSDLGTALLAGATLVVAPEAETRDGPSLFETIERRAITYVDLPPAFLRVLEPARCPASLRCIVIGGEACPPEVVRRWAERVRVVNVYGPTEATICSSLCACDPARWTKPLVGRSLAGITYLVLDEAGRAAKEGQGGELCIAGEGLAIGYLHQPELTAERFVELAGRRFYRTGDRVLVHPDGELEFVGRLDRQVKVGGVRVELDEVEAELGRVPGVAEAAVVARPEGGLVAFVARAASGASLGPASLRARLRERLPLAAVPRAWVFLEALPRGTSGKLDRAALAEGAALGPDPHAPRPGRRAELASLWARLLGAWPAEGDRFLDAGGDSLAALQLVALAESLGLALSAERLFDNPRFADLVDAPARPAPPADVARLRLDAEAVFASLAAAWGAPASGPTAGAAGAAGFGAVRASGALGAARVPGPLGAKAKAGHALVTGATGFFGAHLLAAIAADYDRLSCLVRAPDEASGRARLAAAAARYGLRFDAARVRVLCGDASSPRFGLAAPLWRELGEDLAAIFHSAGVVNMVWPYERLRAGNLVALGEALRLANEGAPKALHHASTLSVFVSAEPAAPRPREDDALEGTTAVYGGYAQSKWAAERLLRLAAVGPAPLACYRLGLLTGAAAVGSGVGAPADQLSLVVAGLARLGRAPRDRAGLRFDVTPVDYAAAALAHIARAGAPGAPGAVATYHLASDEGASADALIEALRAEGVAIEDVEADEWHELGRRQLDGGTPDGKAPNESTPDEAVAAALLAFTRPASPPDHARRRPLELFPSAGLDFDTTRARGALAGSGIACPAAGADLLRRYVRLALRDGGAA